MLRQYGVASGDVCVSFDGEVLWLKDLKRRAKTSYLKANLPEDRGGLLQVVLLLPYEGLFELNICA